jgi:hypothetical protein
MIGRRSLLRLLAAAPLADMARAVSAKDVSSLLDEGEVELANPAEGFAVEPEPFDPDDFDTYHIYEALFEGRSQAPYRASHLPEHIVSKKSWSPAFKLSCARKEEEERRRIREALQRDKSFRKKVGKMLGLKPYGYYENMRSPREATQPAVNF